MTIPTGLTRDVILALSSDHLYALEQAGDIAREVLDERVIAWTEEGWSQRRIAAEIGCSQPAVSKRQQRLGIAPAQPHVKSTDNPVITSPEEAPRLEAVPSPDHPRVVSPGSIPGTVAGMDGVLSHDRIADAAARLGIKAPIQVKFTRGQCHLGSHYMDTCIHGDAYHVICVSQAQGFVEMSNTLWHELAHAMQTERDGKLDRGRQRTPYRQRPCEVEARRIADEHADELLTELVLSADEIAA